MKNKYIRLIVIAYIAINILGVIVYYAMPKGNFVQAKTGVDLNQLDGKYEEVLNNPKVLGYESSVDKYNIKKYSFDYEEKDIEFIFAKQQYPIFLDRKTTEDNKIEVYWYAGPITINSIDFSMILKGPDIKLLNNKLLIEFEKQKYSFTQFSKDLVINQFYDNNETNNVGGGFGSGVIYLKIPKNLIILRDEEYNYINN